MKYVKLGNSDLLVSKICLGCMGFGQSPGSGHSWALSNDKSRKIIKKSIEAGINFFDTAMSYQNGESEKILGQAIRDYTTRSDVIIATKFSPRSEMEIKNNIDGCQHVSNCLEASLKRLQVDYIDLYILHSWDYNTPIQEILAGLNEAVKKNKVRYIGISNCYAWQLAKANAIARAHNWPQFISVQGHYNLIFREEEREMIPLCKEENIAITPYSALASGRLSRYLDSQTKRMQEDIYAKGKYDKTHNVDEIIIKRVYELANRRNVSMTEVSLSWLMDKATAPVIGATKIKHITDAINAVSLQLTIEEKKYLEECYIPHELVGMMAINNN